MLRNYRILLAILLFAVLIDRLKADDDDEENGEGNEGGDGQAGEAGDGQENEDGAATEENEAEGDGEQDGPGVGEAGKEDEEQTEKSDVDAEKPSGEDEENNEDGAQQGKDKNKPGKPGLPGKDSKDANKKDDKGQQGGIDQGNKDRKKTNNAPETDKNTPINQPGGQGTGQSGIGQPGQQQPGGQPNVNPNNNIPYSPTVYPNGLPGQSQQTNINPSNVNPINPPYVNPIPNPVYPQQTNVPLPTNPPPVYPQYPSANQQPPQQQPYSPPSGFGTSNSVNDIDADPFGFGITLQREQQQQYSPYSQYYSQPNQNIPPQYNPPTNNLYSNNLGGFGNSNGKRVPGQTSFPVEESCQLPMIVSGSNSNNYNDQRELSLGRGRRSDDQQQQQPQQAPVQPTVCFRPSPGTSDFATWFQNITNEINSNPQKFQPVQNNGLSNLLQQQALNGGIPEICTKLAQQNIPQTNVFQQGILARKKRSNGRD